MPRSWYMALAFAVTLLASAPAAGQLPPESQLPPDTYSHEEIQTLLERAREARERTVEGLESYEGRLWERIYVGVGAARFRRERGLFHQERAATLRWSADGDHVLRWEGARRDVPLAGLSSVPSPRGTGGTVEDEIGGLTTRMGRRLARSLSRGSSLPPPLSFEPGSDRIVFGVIGSGDGSWALHPLADTAGLHYRFQAGDTLRITLPDRSRPVTLTEVRVEPRRAAFHLLSASLWFHDDTGALVRATYRPSRPFDLEVDDPDGAGDVPRLLLPIRFEIRHVTVDHGFFDFRWWIPRRFSFEGEMRMGPLRMPASFEWTISGLRANAAPDPELLELPPGWSREEVEREEDGEVTRRVAVLVPPPSLLGEHPDISPPDDRGRAAFRAEELRELEGRLGGLAPGADLFAPRFSWGFAEGMTRFNRVEGLSTGVSGSVDVGWNVELRGELRLGIADLEPRGEVGVWRGVPGRGEGLAVYHRLESASEWAPVHSLPASLATVLWGGERTPFYGATGAEAVLRQDGKLSTRSMRLFGERHRSAERGTNAHLRGLLYGDTLALNPPAEEGRWFGAGASHRWQSGVDPARARVFTRIRVEGGAGATEYGRGWAGAALSVPLGGRWTGALETAAGTTVGEPPRQRWFYPGGAQGFRGIRAGELGGDAFWMGRAEVGVGFTGARATLFSDLLRVGPRDEVFSGGRPERAAGAGLSLLDGLLRVDVVRTLGTRPGWRVMGYLDGLL